MLSNKIMLSDEIFRDITENRFKSLKYPLNLKKKDNIWCCGNQLSTYELITKIFNNYILNEANNIVNIHRLYNIVKNDQETYGVYASNNCWTPKFTDTQLLNLTLEFDKLIYNN